jgi:hypothetical protein
LTAELESLTARIAERGSFSSIKKAIGDSEKSLQRNVHIKPAMMALALELKEYINQSS